MDLIKILYEPHFIIIVLSTIIAGVTYYLLKNDKQTNKNLKDSNKKISEIGKNVLYSFLISFVVLIVIYYSFNYLSKNNYFQRGGASSGSEGVSNAEQIKNSIMDKLTIVADDVDCGLLED
jgi:uncharacterized membrane protein (UPF0182 family)